MKGKPVINRSISFRKNYKFPIDTLLSAQRPLPAAKPMIVLLKDDLEQIPQQLSDFYLASRNKLI